MLTKILRKSIHSQNGGSGTGPGINEGVVGIGGAALPETLEDDLEALDSSFEQAVTQARKSRSSAILSNKSASHARHVMLELFDLAFEMGANVFIVSGRLNPVCYGERLVAKLDQIVARGISVQLITTDLNEAGLRASLFGKKVLESKQCKAFVSDDSGYLDDAPHFCVVRGHGFRFETNKASAEAVLSFDRPEIASQLEASFSSLKSHCKEVLSVS